MRRREWITGMLACGVLSAAGRAQGPDPLAPMQQGGIPSNQVPSMGRRPDQTDRNESFPGSGEKQARLRNDERQRRLVSDTDKLLTLVTQLHADVAKTDKNVLSLDVVRRAEEIEKLARAVKERMRG